MGSCAAPSAKGDDKFITTDYLQQCHVAHQQFDRILVCTETPAESIDTQLLKALAEVAPVVEIVTYE
ncbi:hypothetical protein GJ091_22340 [Salmonella enterica]|nr:hypothetical protein [Salmonella enterica subsp. enterica serovar Kentucky]